MPRCLFICAVLLFYAAPCPAQDAAKVSSTGEVSFVVLGKSANHRQVTEGVYALLNYHFSAEIFLAKDGVITDARLSSANDAGTMLFADTPPVLEFHGGRYASEQALNQAHPDGEYLFSWRSSNGRPAEQSMKLGNESDETRLPFPVVVYLSQDGQPVAANAIDPDKDLEISWSPFISGAADANEISDDLIFAVTGDCHGMEIDHSGPPFSAKPPLTFASSQHSVPAAKLYPGEPFQLFVEHADLQTGGRDQVPGIASFSAKTFVDIRTLGERLPERAPCPELMPAMDAGQSDRPKPVKIDL